MHGSGGFQPPHWWAALFAQGVRELNEWADAGWEAVDMETAATLAVAEHFQMDSAAILYVFDNPRLHGDIVPNELQKDDRRRRGNAAMIEWTFDIIDRQSRLTTPDRRVHGF